MKKTVSRLKFFGDFFKNAITNRKVFSFNKKSQTFKNFLYPWQKRLKVSFNWNILPLVLFAVVCISIFYFILPSHAAGITKYPVIAGGNWSADATWTLNADGTTNATVAPTVSDDVIMNSTSGAVTIDATAVAKTVNCTGYTNTLTHNAFTLTVSGSVTLAATKYTAIGVNSILAMNATGTLVSAGNTLYNLSTSVGTITLGDALTINGGGGITVNSGALITDGGAGSLTHNIGNFVTPNDTTARTITLGNSTININGDGNNRLNIPNTTNLTFNANTSTINFTGATYPAVAYAAYGGPGITFNNVNFTNAGLLALNTLNCVYNNITIVPGMGIISITKAITFANMTMASAGIRIVKFTKNTTYTMTGTNFLSGSATTGTVAITSDDGTTAATLNKTGGGVVNSDYLDITVVNVTPANTWYYGSNSTWHSGTGWVFGQAKTWSAAADGNWETAGNWTPSGAPAAGDTVIFDATSIKNCTVTTYSSGNGIADGIGSISLNTGYSGTINFQKKPSQNADPFKINITGDFIINNGTVTSDGDVTVQHGGVTDGRGNEFDAANLTIGSSGNFNANGKGFTAGNGPGSGSGTGASYGGEGFQSTPSKAYGDYSNPVSLGSGSGGAGGGAIVLNVTNTLDIMGTISANGGPTSTSAGSGGSVNLIAATISNSSGGGSITANGGNGGGGSTAGGGGGGRIKLGATTISYSGTFLAGGGNYGGGWLGTAGTIYKIAGGQSYGDLIIDDGTYTPPIYVQTAAHLKTSSDTGSYQFDSITCRNYGRLAIDAGQTLALDSGSITGNKNSGFINAGAVSVPASWTIGYFFSTKNGTVTDPGLSSKDVIISSTGLLTHYPNPVGVTEVYKLNWTINSLNVQATGEINVAGVGFAAGYGPGYDGSTAAYGGESSSATAGKVYGDYSNPTNLGSGSGGAAGGGAIIISTTGNIAVTGTISAGGVVSSGDGSSSGGTVNLSAGGILSGAGSITANGVGAFYGSSGGGRVKLAGTTISFNGTLTATGNSGYSGTSAAGTVYKIATGQSYGDLIIDNGANTPAVYTQTAAHLKTSSDTGSYQFDSITARNYGRLMIDAGQTLALDSGSITGNKNSGFINAGAVSVPASWTIGYFFSTKNGTVTDPGLSSKDVIISSTGLLTHYPNPVGVTEVYKLNWTINSLNVQATGEINVAGVGFPGGYGPGADGNGAAYGGESLSATAGKVYGDYSNPSNLGSGGGSSGSGGGAIIISTTGNTVVAGTISAGGISYNERTGSGGTVNLAAGGTLSGAGSITANGVGAFYGSSGGGRVKLAGSTISFNGTLTATGNSGWSGTSAAGTVFKIATGTQTYGDLIIDNGANTGATVAYTPTTAPLQLDSVAVKNYGKFRLDTNTTTTSDTLTTTGDINVTTHGEMKLMSDNDGTPAKGAGMTVTAANVSTDATSSIHSNGQGFIHDSGYSNGKGLVGTLRGGGGAFGGAGGASNDGGAGGQVYGSTTDVAYIGSGGGAANLGGQAGGLITMNVSSTITNAGTISVNGANGTTNGGGGSGGGIQITTVNCTSSGTISANGGNGATNAGGGGGGRIYINYSGSCSPSPAPTATGGTGANYGSNGTVDLYTQLPPAAPTLLTPTPDSGNIPGTNWIATDSGNNWSYRKPITISHTNVTSTLTNFPAKVEISADTDIGAHAKSDLTDLRFTDSGAVTVLPAERETGTVTGGSASGIFWVQVPSVSSSVDTIIYAYYGNSAASAQASPSSVWDSNYKGVYHLPNGSVLGALDSTSNGNNGTINGATATTGKIDGSGNFVKTSSQNITKASNLGLGTTSVSLFTWVNVPSVSQSGAALKIGDGSSGYGIGVGGTNFDTNGNNLVALYEGVAWKPSSVSIGTGWHQIGMTIDASGLSTLYLDGAGVYSPTGGGARTPSAITQIGGYSARYWNGGIDEVELSTSIRSAEWIKFEYYNQKDTAGQLSYGVQTAGTFLATNVSKTPAFTFSTTDSNGDYLRYKLQLASDSAFTSNLSEFIEGSDAGGQTQTSNGLTAVYSGQDSQSSTAYASGTTATLTISGSTPLTNGATYYWRVYAIDPGGSNSWSSPSSTLAIEVLPLGPIDHFTLTAYSTSVTAGSGLTTDPTVIAYDAAGNVKTNYTGEVWFTSSDGAATLTYNTGNHYTFISGDLGVKDFSGSDFVFNSAGAQTITLKNGDGAADVTSSNILVSPAGIDHFTIVTSATTATAGAALPNTVNATAYDTYSNVKTDYTGQVWFTSSDGAAVLTYNAGNHYTFIGGDNGSKTFLASAFVLNTTGNQTITLKNGDGKPDVTTGNILVSASGIDHFTLTAYSTSVVAGSALATGPTVTAYDASNNVKTDYTGQVWFTSSDGAAVLTYNTGAHYTFLVGDNGVKVFNGSDVILKTTGNQTITLKNGDGKPDVVSSNILVSAGGIDHFTIVTSATTATAGSALPNTVNATAYDTYSNVKTDYTGQVWFTSSDGAAVLTYNTGNHYTFTSGDGLDNGTHIFAGSDFVLATADNQTITLKNGDGKADQTTGNILVSAGAIDHITVTPTSLTLNSGDTGQFSATSYDQFNNQRTDTFTWSVAAGGGAIDQSGNFTAGIVGGVFSNTVKAEVLGVDSYASVTVNAAAIPPTTPSNGSNTSEPTSPNNSGLKTPPVVPTETAPQTSTAKADITLSDFHFYTMLDSGNIELKVSDLSNIEVTNNSNILIEIPADIFSKEVNVITISTGDSTYLMNLLTGKNKYQAVIPMPTVKGQFEFRILIIYKDGTIKEIKKNVTVDPQGYVYTKSSSYFGLGNKQEVRIEGAQMTLYKVDSGVSKLVDPTEVKQANPIKTNSSGEYTFYVPNGEYYLVAEKAGYKTVTTDNFKVDNLIVNKNVEIELKVKPWVWLIVAGLAIFAIIFLLIRRRRKTNNIRE